MKKLILSVLLVGLTGFFISCAKPGTTPTKSVKNSMTASISGTAWTAQSMAPVANSVDVTITAYASDGSNIKMTMPPLVSIKPGTYTFSQSGDYTFQYSNTVTNFLVNSGSTLTITSYSNNTMVGTFTASVTGGSVTESITNGAFTAIFE